MNLPATGRVTLDVTPTSPRLRNGIKVGQTMSTLHLTIDRDGSSSPCTTSG